MSDVWSTVRKGRQAGYPREDFTRFVSRYYYDAPDRAALHFLDLGCGAGANTSYLLQEGFTVTAVDRILPEKVPTFHSRLTVVEADLTEWVPPADKFDCVLDNTTLCHIERADLVLPRAHAALKEGGRMFSVWPTRLNHPDNFAGRGFVSYLTFDEVRWGFHMFKHVQIGRLMYTNMVTTRLINYWLIEAQK